MLYREHWLGDRKEVEDHKCLYGKSRYAEAKSIFIIFAKQLE